MDRKGFRVRMWMIDPVLLCDRHLLGEHVECHMLAGVLARRRSIAGFVAKGLLEPSALGVRHAALAEEMLARGFRHASPLGEQDLAYLSDEVAAARVDTDDSARDLAARCESCRIRLGGALPQEERLSPVAPQRVRPRLPAAP